MSAQCQQQHGGHHRYGQLHYPDPDRSGPDSDRYGLYHLLRHDRRVRGLRYEPHHHLPDAAAGHHPADRSPGRPGQLPDGGRPAATGRGAHRSLRYERGSERGRKRAGDGQLRERGADRRGRFPDRHLLLRVL